MRHDGFLRDVLAAPARLDACLDAYAGGSPLDDVRAPARVVFVGMGSSRFAALPAAALLRSQGIDAVAELASTGLPAAPRPGTLAVAISASGTTPETVEALAAHRGRSHTVAVTNDPESELAGVADVVVPLHAGVEEGGVACLTYQATLAVLQLLAGRIGRGPGVDDLRPAVEAAARLRDGRTAWLDELADRLEAAPTTYAIAPAERLSSALQSALMLREGPRRASDATETGDWLHVDVYLSRRPGYTAILFPGSRFDAGVMEYARERGAAVVSVGCDPGGAVQVVPLPGAETPLVRLLVETSVAELAAADLWRRGVDAHDPALVV